MSLCRFALRLITTKALEGNTWADDRVRDSTIADLEESLRDNPQPVMLIYTDDSESDPSGKEIMGGGGGVNQLAIVVAVAGAVTRPAEDGVESATEIQLPHTDASIEMALDFIERQIQVALGDLSNPWARLWQQLVVRTPKYKSVRGASSKTGVRYGARQILIDCDTCMDPPPGAPAEGFWADLLDQLAEGDEDTRGLGLLLQGQIEGKPRPQWERKAMRYGMSKEALFGIGLGPLLDHAEPGDDAATLYNIRIDGNGTESGTDGEA